ncbi:MAG: hypothetical protein A3J74_02765 [Elusimicrobia bacterium RIFCSPHIGHO2_02_FULL_57_9]|nr:MAG: hypothetical protein A3J74_02765 [Elusimicrobia bacterium RIFCSPHIGHO2_02_FULL_57_9]
MRAGLILLALAAAGLRLAGISWGLPHAYNADEPHIINLALSFGAGTLRPYAFKYPTLWPYLLFFFYGFYFLFWSGLGLRRGIVDFIGLYAWEPAGFYLIARALSAIFSLLGVAFIWKAQREDNGQSYPWAALLLTFSPVIVELAHSAKPDCLMFFFVCAAWYFALRVYRLGERRDYRLCGASLGFAVSSQYTALPVAVLLPLAHFLGRQKSSFSRLAEGTGLSAACFFLGSPFALIDFSALRAGLNDHNELFALTQWDGGEVLRSISLNVWSFAGVGSVAGLAAVLGLGLLCYKETKQAVVILGPIVLYILMLSRNPDGGWPRYLLGCFPGLALLAAQGLSWLDRPQRPLMTVLLAATSFFPGMARSARMDREMRLPDTRAQAESWILSHIPKGSTLLLDEAHASPRLPMQREQVLQLMEQTRRRGSPRARLYQGMAQTHPGDGYRLLRIQRTARELHSAPRHVELSQADSPVLDVRPGLDTARAARVEYVVTSSFGANPQISPELAVFFDELYGHAEFLRSFEPLPGQVAGPVLRVFAL